MGYRPRRGTYEQLIGVLCDAGDARCVGILRDYKTSGDPVSAVERRVRKRFESVGTPAVAGAVDTPAVVDAV
ncbi:hypothetical protein OPT61_g8086 [Boeremia exigua]|uniref:Uncharacterized protein n=1 Tax=Boeremia exigua TaxID=749465 RepID=A0ACC2I0P1_9PLEO|nr:hypothetical protein OPT61_g8086 [Boeremia exigua]